MKGELTVKLIKKLMILKENIELLEFYFNKWAEWYQWFNQLGLIPQW